MPRSRWSMSDLPQTGKLRPEIDLVRGFTLHKTNSLHRGRLRGLEERPANASPTDVHAMVRSRCRNATGDHNQMAKPSCNGGTNRLRLDSLWLELGRGRQCHTSILISSSARNSKTRAA